MSKKIPSQQQLILPLLESIADAGGTLSSKEAYKRVADKVDIEESIRTEKINLGKAGFINPFERTVRWAKQRAKLLKLIETPSKGKWNITGTGRKALRQSEPGVVITIFETDNGVALWGSCEDALQYVDNHSIKLIMTSPPYPLTRKKSYGNLKGDEYIDWMLRVTERLCNTLTSDGSMVINFGDTWNSGSPTINLYQERLLIKMEDTLGLKLCQRFFWENPSKLPTPAEWVTIKRIRVKPSVEQLYWLSMNGQPDADNRRVLVEYSQSMKKRLTSGGETESQRPSGHSFKRNAFSKDNGGAIPGNLLMYPNTNSNSKYIQQCKSANIPIHPARFPDELPNFFIRFLTQENDTVLDPFAGSCVTAQEAEKLNRNWIMIDKCLDYLKGARLRFC